MMRRLPLPALLLAVGCGEPTGGVTAHLVISEEGLARRGLSTRAVPMEVDALEISAHDTRGSTLAFTRLAATPSGAELPLIRAGGTWSLEDVPVGDDRIIKASAFLSEGLPGALAGRLAFFGQKSGLEVRGGEVTNAGTITLELVDGVRIPRLDRVPPGAPSELGFTLEPGGFRLRWTRPRDADVAGYLVAVAGTQSGPPTPDPAQFTLPAGSEIAPGVFLAAWNAQPELTEALVEFLPNISLHHFFVFAYDATLENMPLNFSPALTGSGVATDTDPPAVAGDLRIARVDVDTASVSFVGPSEDTLGGGPPTAYHVRTSTTRAELEDPARFEARVRVTPPPVVAPGARGGASYSFLDLGVDGDATFYLGLRAVDADGNVGPIAIAQYDPGLLEAPIITRVVNGAALAGGELRVEGRRFGSERGTVELRVLTGTVATRLPLPITRWTPTEVALRVPANARSGRLELTRFADHQMNAVELPVIAQLAAAPQPVLPPFAIASSTAALGGVVHAVYEIVDGPQTEHGVRRIFGEVPSLSREATTLAGPALAVSASYDAAHGRFAFAAATSTEITAALVSNAPIPEVLRRTIANVGGADGVGLALLPTTTTATAIPALLAFSVQDRVRTATTADLRLGSFEPFTIVATSSSGLSGAQLLYAPGPIASAFLAYRVGTGTTASLALMSQQGARPGGFVEDAPGMGPPIAERFVLLDVPSVGLVIAYEHRAPNGLITTRLLAQSSFGLGPGIAAMPLDGVEIRLEDASLVHRDGRAWIALAATTPAAGGRQLLYVEIDPARLAPDGSAQAEALRLDIALAGTPRTARLGGKPFVVPSLPLIWNGPDAGGITYVRR